MNDNTTNPLFNKTILITGGIEKNWNIDVESNRKT